MDFLKTMFSGVSTFLSRSKGAAGAAVGGVVAYGVSEGWSLRTTALAISGLLTYIIIEGAADVVSRKYAGPAVEPEAPK